MLDFYSTQLMHLEREHCVLIIPIILLVTICNTVLSASAKQEVDNTELISTISTPNTPINNLRNTSNFLEKSKDTNSSGYPNDISGNEKSVTVEIVMLAIAITSAIIALLSWWAAKRSADIAEMSLLPAQTSAEAAVRTAQAAERTAKAATRRSLESIDNTICQSFGKTFPIPSAQHIFVKFVNTGREVVRLDFYGCESTGTDAFKVKRWVIEVKSGEEKFYENFNMETPIPAGYQAHVNLEIEFDPDKVIGLNVCEGSLVFSVKPALDEGGEYIMVPYKLFTEK